MSKTAVIYWSATGNTAQMAQTIYDHLSQKGQDVELLDVDTAGNIDVTQYDGIAFGCPAMGVEVLEESTFDPFFTSVETSLTGKKVLLFGSYGWGDGTWMRNWEERVNGAGAILVRDGVICLNQPDDSTLSELKDAADLL